MNINRALAEKVLSQMKEIVEANLNYTLISKSYADQIIPAIASLERRINRGDFGEVAK